MVEKGCEASGPVGRRRLESGGCDGVQPSEDAPFELGLDEMVHKTLHGGVFNEAKEEVFEGVDCDGGGGVCERTG